MSIFRVVFVSALVAASVATLPGCVTNAATGKSQLNLLSREQEIALGAEEGGKMTQAYGGAITDPQLAGYINRVATSMLPYVEGDYGSLPWEFTFIDSDEINAFALPGGKVFVTRGLAMRLTNEGQLAGVLGHEIGHVTAEHADKHISQALILNGVVTVTGAVVGDGSATTQIAMQALETGSGLFALKFSRADELEADRLGLRYMTKAGYDPLGLRQVMELFLELSAGGRQPEFLSTHPAPETRIDQIDERLKDELRHTQNNPAYSLHEQRFTSEFLRPLRARFGGSSVSAVDVEAPAVWCALCRDHG